MPKFIDLTGQKFGKLTVLFRSENNIGGRTAWVCRCECGNIKSIVASSLVGGASKSCGCIHHNGRTKYNSNGESKKTTNSYDLSGNFGIGYTNKQEPFYFDLEDYDKIKSYSWYISSHGYVVSNYKSLDSKKQCRVFMHRLVMGICDSKQFVDHIYHNKTDNRKSQLRIVTPQQNSQNHLPYSNSKYYSGVYYYKNKWQVLIGIDGETKYLGLYDTYEEAVRVRKDAEIKYFGEYKYNCQEIFKNDLTKSLKCDII